MVAGYPEKRMETDEQKIFRLINYSKYLEDKVKELKHENKALEFANCQLEDRYQQFLDDEDKE